MTALLDCSLLNEGQKIKNKFFLTGSWNITFYFQLVWLGLGITHNWLSAVEDSGLCYFTTKY